MYNIKTFNKDTAKLVFEVGELNDEDFDNICRRMMRVSEEDVSNFMKTLETAYSIEIIFDWQEVMEGDELFRGILSKEPEKELVVWPTKSM